MKAIFLLLILFTVAPAALSSTDEGVELSITLIRGERSKDSHSTTQKIRISGNQATFDLKYGGRRDPQQKPLQRTITLTKNDLKIIRQRLDEHNWLPEEKGEFLRAGAMTYFSIAIGFGQGTVSSNILLTGTPGHPEIKTDEKYMYVKRLVTEIFRILNEHDRDIEFSNVVG